MTPERVEKLRRILRLASLLAEDERDSYLKAMTSGDDEMRRAVEAYFMTSVSEELTLREALPPQPASAPGRPLRFTRAEVPAKTDLRAQRAFSMVCELSESKRAAIAATARQSERDTPKT